MKNVTIPLELFDDLVENTIDCLNSAANLGKDELENLYRIELDRCEKIREDLSRDR